METELPDIPFKFSLDKMMETLPPLTFSKLLTTYKMKVNLVLLIGTPFNKKTETESSTTVCSMKTTSPVPNLPYSLSIKDKLMSDYQSPHFIFTVQLKLLKI